MLLLPRCPPTRGWLAHPHSQRCPAPPVPPPLCAPLCSLFSPAVAAVRPGTDGTPFIYTLNMSCPEELWGDLQPAFARGVAAFR